MLTRILVALAFWALAGTPSNAQQTIRAGVAITGAPFSFHDDASNSDQGLMVDLIKEIAKTAGFRLELQPMAFSALIPALTTNRVDVLVGTFGITPERKAQISFSQKVYTDSDALIVPKTDTTGYVSYEDLKGKVLGLQKGVVALTSLRTALYPKIRIYDGAPDLMQALAAGEVDVGVANRSIVGYLLKTGAFPSLQLVTTFKPTVLVDVAFGMRKDEALLKTVDGALATIQSAGTMNTLIGKWGMQ
jgi:polar amino acid transport system substrate-binding protein